MLPSSPRMQSTMHTRPSTDAKSPSLPRKACGKTSGEHWQLPEYKANTSLLSEGVPGPYGRGALISGGPAASEGAHGYCAGRPREGASLAIRLGNGAG